MLLDRFEYVFTFVNRFSYACHVFDRFCQMVLHFGTVLDIRFISFDVSPPSSSSSSSSSSPHATALQSAFQDQLRIGIDAFKKGFLSKQWIELQNQYYYTTIRDSKFNIMRWKKAIVSLIIDRGNELWEEQCTIMHLTNKSTEETRCRKYLYEFYSAQKNKQELNVRDAHLLKRSRKYFSIAHVSVLEMWHSRVLGAIDREKARRKHEGDDISKFVVRKRRKKRRHKVSIIEPQVRNYKQTNPWKDITYTSPPPAAPIPSTARKRQLLQKISQRTKRKRQTKILPLQKISPLQQNKIRNQQTTKNNINKLCRKRKRASSTCKYVSIKARKSIRDRLRLSGIETKNNR